MIRLDDVLSEWAVDCKIDEILLDESSKSEDPKLKRYLKNINREMEKIRQIISRYPKNHK